MEFRGNRSQNQRAATSGGQQTVATSAAGPASSSLSPVSAGRQFGRKNPKAFKLGAIIILFSAAILIIALLYLLVFSGNGAMGSVKKNSYQAVFLNNGQVYFGKINQIGDRNIDLRNIYYLQTNSAASTSSTSTQNSNVSLVKLGCELHSPFDQMIINTDQVIFWENIQDSGQVVKAIKDYQTKNADQQCSTQSQSSTQQSPSTTTPSSSGSTTTKP